MTISSHESGKDGYLEVYSPNGANVAVFRDLSEVAMGAPTRGKLWVNGKRVYGNMWEEFENLDLDAGFGASCAWSPDSRYLMLVQWIETKKRSKSTHYAIYDVRSETLRPIISKKGQPILTMGQTVEGFHATAKWIKECTKVDVYASLNIPVPTDQDFGHTKDIPTAEKNKNRDYPEEEITKLARKIRIRGYVEGFLICSPLFLVAIIMIAVRLS